MCTSSVLSCAGLYPRTGTWGRPHLRPFVLGRFRDSQQSHIFRSRWAPTRRPLPLPTRVTFPRLAPPGPEPRNGTTARRSPPAAPRRGPAPQTPRRPGRQTPSGARADRDLGPLSRPGPVAGAAVEPPRRPLLSLSLTLSLSLPDSDLCRSLYSLGARRAQPGGLPPAVVSAPPRPAPPCRRGNTDSGNTGRARGAGVAGGKGGRWGSRRSTLGSLGSGGAVQKEGRGARRVPRGPGLSG